jgi:hypothetical protein
MKKLLTLSLLAIMVLGASAFATATRTYTLGQTGSILLDEDNIFMYPSRINMYPNIAVGDVGTDYGVGGISDFDAYNDQGVASFGVHWKFNEKNPWVLGTYFFDDGEQYSDHGLGLSNTWLPLNYWMPYLNWVPTGGSNKRVTLVYGRKLGSNYFGFSLNKVQASYKDETAAPNNDGKEGVGAYDFGFSLTDGAGKWDVAAGINLLSFSDMEDETHDNWKSKGNKSFYGYGRMFHQMNPQWTVVPNAGFVIGKFEAEEYDGGTPQAVDHSEKYTSTTFWLGMGAHYTPAPNMLAVGEVGFGYNSTKFNYTDPITATNNYEWKDSYMTLPYFKVGLEGKMFDWMDLRFGATSNWHRETFETSNYFLTALPTKEKYNYPDNQTYFGTGLHFGNFHIDTYTSPEIFLKGFYFVSGNQSDNQFDNLNAHVSVLYEFK